MLFFTQDHLSERNLSLILDTPVADTARDWGAQRPGLDWGWSQFWKVGKGLSSPALFWTSLSPRLRARSAPYPSRSSPGSLRWGIQEGAPSLGQAEPPSRTGPGLILFHKEVAESVGVMTLIDLSCLCPSCADSGPLGISPPGQCLKLWGLVRKLSWMGPHGLGTSLSHPESFPPPDWPV